MLKNTLLKGFTTLNTQLFRNTSYKSFFQIISNNTFILNKANKYAYTKKFFSSQDQNKANKENTDNNDIDKNNKTELVLKEKKKKKSFLKSKSEEIKKTEKAEVKTEKAEVKTDNAQVNTESVENPTESHQAAESEAKPKKEEIKEEEKKKDYKLNKEEEKNIKKMEYRAKIKEAINLKDMYQIKSSKMGAVNPRKFFDFSKIKHNNVSVKIFDRATFLADEKFDNKNLTPISPKLGPYIIENPKIENKTYHWCSCGLSKKQPFCDSSHSQTGFRPINFKLAEKCESMMLCGCKLSKVAPFCDGATCVEMKKIEEEGIKKQVEIIDSLPNTEKLSENNKKKKEGKTINTTSSS